MIDDPVLLSQVTIRQATRDDLPALEWDGEFIHFRRLYEEVYLQALKGSSLMWVAELQKEGIIGQVFVSLTSYRSELSDGINRAYVYGFRVKPLYRNRGVGGFIMTRVEADLVERGYKSVTLNVGRDNHQARRLYERLGYKVVAAEPGRWSYIDHLGQRQEVIEPAWRMEKNLASV